MNKDINIYDIINKLIKLTRNEQIKWERGRPSSFLIIDEDEKVDMMYITKYKNRFLRLYEKKYKSYESDAETYYWDSTVILELVDDEGLTEWKFPFDNNLWELIEAVKYQTADVKGFLESFSE